MLIARAVLWGMAVMLAGTLPRNILFALNIQYFNSVPWAVPVTAAYLWVFWRYLDGHGQPHDTAHERKLSLRAVRLNGQLWTWSLFAGILGIIALVAGLRLANRLVVLPEQQLPDLSHVSRFTVVSLLVMAAPVAGIVEEAAFRGYMQGPIERNNGIIVAVLITGTMFGIAHLDFTLKLWPYYVAVAALYGAVTYLTQSILPAVVLHTLGNLYSNSDLWLHGQAEWQAASHAVPLVWQTGLDRDFWIAAAALSVSTVATVLAFLQLARITRSSRGLAPQASVA